MNTHLNVLIDGKINGICFNFDACAEYTQDLVIYVQNLTDKIVHYKVKFINVSSSEISLKFGEFSMTTNNYHGDCLYIDTINLIAQNQQRQHWKITLIENIGFIEIFSDDMQIEIVE